VVTVSFLWAQAPKLKAVAKTATIMIIFINFNLSPLLSSQVALPVHDHTEATFLSSELDVSPRGFVRGRLKHED
jgi:hypothetical protein